jgi:copper resistance protein D
MLDFALVAARLAHYAATTTLAGASFFPLYACASTEPEASRRWRGRLLLVSAIVAVLSGLLWLILSAANMSGSLSDLADGEVLWTVVHDTQFGLVWSARLLLAVVLICVIATRPVPARAFDWIVAIPAAVLLASLAGTGHAQIEDGWRGVVHVTSDAAHLVAAGAWLGGLVPLAFILAHHAANEGAGGIDVIPVLNAFSGMGYFAVATLIGSGAINSLFLVGSLSSLVHTPYGWMLLVKLVLFAGMLALAIANRFWLVPSMQAGVETSQSNAAISSFRSLRNHVVGEQLLGALVLLIVSILGTMQPAAGG